MTVTAALAQFATDLDKDANRKFVVDAFTAAQEAGARLVVTPENSMYADFAKVDTDSDWPEPLDGPFVTAVREAARSTGVAGVVGFSEKLPGDKRASNTLAAVDGRGELLGVYRKVHLYDAFGYRESDTIAPADVADPLVFELDGITFGAMTCYDIRFPESARVLADAGATALVVPAAWAVGPAKEEHWATLVRARAIENTVYVLACGQTGPSCVGQSVIVDPMGTVVAGAGERPGVVTAPLSPERVESVRRVNPSLANRRFAVVPA
jgi:predicted amidohydrolase